MVTGESSATTKVVNEEMVKPESKSKSDIPDWLNEPFFEDIFVEQEQLERGKFKVKINKIIPTGGAGENYTSMLYRANVDAECNDGTLKNLAVIVKAMIATSPEIKQMGAFLKERFAYDKLLPRLEQLWTDAGEPVKFGPRCWKTIEGDTEILVLDDLCASGYSVANRQQGADLKHAHKFLEKLAKFHAATATDYKKNGPITDLYREYMPPEAKDFVNQYFNSMKQDLLDSLQSWPEYGRYSEKMIHNMTEIYDKLNDASKKEDTEFVVLNHGDAWTNNHMYSYDESGVPKDAQLIDFQISYYGSPVLDLFYYIVSSLSLDLKTSHYDHLIQYYHEKLAEALRKLDYPGKIPNLRDIHMDMLKRGYFGFQCLYGVLPVVLADKSENANFAAFTGDSEESRKFRHDMYNNPLYQEHLRQMLKFFDVRGLLDYE